MQILKVSDISVNHKQPKYLSENNCKLVSTNYQPDFKGANYPSGYYTDEEIADAYRVLNDKEDEWESNLMSILCGRWGFFKYVCTRAPEKRVAEVKKLREDLLEIQRQIERQKELKEKYEKELLFEKQRQEEKQRLEKALSEPKAKFNDEFLNLVSLSKNNENISIPNAIMIQGKYNHHVQKFTEWILTAKETNNNVYSVQKNKSNNEIMLDIQKIMNNAENNFYKNGKPTLLYIEKFDIIATPKDGNKATIAVLKSLMCSCSEKYHCTIVFDAPENNTIEPILLADSRVQSKIVI